MPEQHADFRLFARQPDSRTTLQPRVRSRRLLIDQLTPLLSMLWGGTDQYRIPLLLCLLMVPAATT